MKIGFNLNAFSLIKNVPVEDILINLNNLYENIKFDIEKISSIDSFLKIFKKNNLATYNRLVISKLTGSWTVIFDDAMKSDGGYSNLYNFNRLFAYEGLVVNHRNEGTIFNYFNSSSERTVYSINDNKWEFFQKGIPLPFESIEYYNRKQIKNRMNEPIIREYLSRIGINEIESLIISSKEIYLAEKKLNLN